MKQEIIKECETREELLGWLIQGKNMEQILKVYPFPKYKVSVHLDKPQLIAVEDEYLELTVYNVLFKGVEIKPTPFCKVFSSIESAYSFCEASAKKQELKIMSTSGFISGDEKTVGSFTDYRCEDEKGNSYYYVIYVQKLT